LGPKKHPSLNPNQQYPEIKLQKKKKKKKKKKQKKEKTLITVAVGSQMHLLR